MNMLHITWHYLSGSIYLPDSVKNMSGERILHISDTPTSFYPSLRKLLKALKPDYIIHTGDLVDNIKLQLYPRSIPRYEASLKPLIGMLENSSAKAIWLCLGNHDHEATVRRYVKRSIIVPDQLTCQIGALGVSMSHYSHRLLQNPSALNFFGHDLTTQTHHHEGISYFNGISNLHVISALTGEYHALPYPWGTDDNRLGKGRVGF